MNTAKELIEIATNQNNGELNKTALHEALKKSGIEPDQDWDEQTTTWAFEDGSALRDNNGEIHAYGEMPNTDKIDWYLVSM